MKKIFNLAICIPSLHTWPTHFALSLQILMMEMSRVKVPGYDDTGVMVFNKISSLLCQSRYLLVKDALEKKASHILFVDSDQTFPGALVHCLARHQKEFVACNVATKDPENCLPTARSKSTTWWGGDPVYTTPQSKGLEQVWRIGFGVALIATSLFKKVSEPWFNTLWLSEEKTFVGEDWFFCQEAERAGVPLYIDHDASKRVGHLGQYSYEHSNVVVPDRPKLEIAK